MELNKANQKQYELEQDITFYKLDSKFDNFISPSRKESLSDSEAVGVVIFTFL